jgi:hypothetical protein
MWFRVYSIGALWRVLCVCCLMVMRMCCVFLIRNFLLSGWIVVAGCYAALSITQIVTY